MGGGGEKERGRRKGSKIKREKCERKGGGGKKIQRHTLNIYFYFYFRMGMSLLLDAVTALKRAEDHFTRKKRRRSSTST